MSTYTQDGRFLSIVTSLAKDELLLTSINGIESISSLFQFNLTAMSENTDIEAKQLINKAITFTIHDGINRVFNGVVSHFSFGEIKQNGLREYHFTVVPWTWFLDRTENRRIFQNKTCKDIVSQIFSDLAYNDFDFKAAPGGVREYCVQYGESDLTFVMRLLAEEGYASYFKHEDGKHTFVIVDQMSAYAESPQSDLTYSKGDSPDAEINAWLHNYEFKKGEWIVNDYNFKEPNKNLIAESPSKSKLEKNNKFKHYDYPSLYDFASGKNIANARMDAEEVNSNTIAGASSCSSFAAGLFFKLDKHDAKSEVGKYLLLTVHHQAYENTFSTGQGGDEHYSNNFTCMPLENMYRPPMVYNRPVMYGPQSALVTGPKGEEIHIDEFGRIKVQFMWDREGKKDENSSCFVRVMQAWAGNGWGSSFVPRIGHEVIISFLDGDPDRPIVTGSVYNGNNKPPYPSKTQSGIKTHSTKKGGADHYNEIRFEDKKDAEQIYLHAEKDLDTQVENNETLTIDNDRIKTVKHDEISSIGNDRTKTVKHDENSTIENDRNKIVNNNQTESIANNKTIDVGKEHREAIMGNMTINVEKDLSETIKGKYTEAVTKEYGLNAKTITMEADEKIIIKTGSAQIVMKSNGDITISGKNINVKGSGNVVLKGSKVLSN
ncbi:type VI secretion system Vgr family protein [Psychromonas sp. Urea-02u-13]|uniref:type VI secretion system Vgr family protein n=1 Tax=Psychromonas sp. Urea-02u-13 TaxID=2058326 RepID=UPI000C348AA6|nr:type VI secretion system tip protein TssI/VgrG [Psychromonas sp. Urea-02u-13]PKG37371.1 type VI secretion system tip protein VgrG [Psychromonas sp. Urea-02u-13]